MIIYPGVCQGSILDPLFFIYTNDLSGNLDSNVKLFADDASMYLVVRDPINTSQKLNIYLDTFRLWSNK